MNQETMRAAVLTGPKQIELKTVPVPQLEEGMIEVKVSACGVCGSDIHMWKAGKGWAEHQETDFFMGHEFCDVVTRSADSSFHVGDRVVFWANLYCGECDMCKAGQEQLCRQVNGTNYIGFVCNGAYAEKYVGKGSNAYLLPPTVTDVSAALIDPLMVAYHAVRQSGIKLHDKVLVAGSGIIGYLIGALAKKAGASYVAMSKINDRKIQKAKEMDDFDAFFDGNASDRAQTMQAVTNGGFDVAFEAVGSGDALAACMEAVRPGGKIMMIGNSMEPQIPFAMNQAVLREITLMGSVSCTKKEFEQTIDMIAKGMIDPEKYVTDILPLEDLQHAFERLTDESDPVLKIVIKP